MKLNFLEMKLNFFGNEVKQKEAKKVPVRKTLNDKLNRKKCEVKLQVFLQYLPAMKCRVVVRFSSETLQLESRFDFGENRNREV